MESQRNTCSNLSDKIMEECKELMVSLPKAKGWLNDNYLYKGIWCPAWSLPSVVAFQRHFQARDNDIILASYPKSGTTWLKALLFAIVNRNHYSTTNNPLLTANPHALVQFLEMHLYSQGKIPDLENVTSPRTFATHVHYDALPESIKTSNCKIVYVCRNPFDCFVSHWNYYLQMNPEKRLHWTMEEYFESYCRGESVFGPLWDSVLGYWNKSLETPNKVLFLKYEDIKKDTTSHLKKVAEFIGCPFSLEEEKDGVIEGIADLCSLKTLKSLDVNKNGELYPTLKNQSYFRKGEVGDWVNYFTPSMVERLEKLVTEKFIGSGLTMEVTLDTSKTGTQLSNISASQEQEK